jgi:hypothetical protein
MRNALQRTLSSWLDALRKAGFFVLLVAGSAGLGLLIAWPLWLFATSARGTYTIVVVSLMAAGVIFLIVRGILRRRGRMRDPGQPRRNALTLFLGILIGAVGIAGVYAAAVLFARRLWVFALPLVTVWACLLWVLSLLRRLSRARKEPAIPAENIGE